MVKELMTREGLLKSIEILSFQSTAGTFIALLILTTKVYIQRPCLSPGERRDKLISTRRRCYCLLGMQRMVIECSLGGGFSFDGGAQWPSLSIFSSRYPFTFITKDFS